MDVYLLTLLLGFLGLTAMALAGLAGHGHDAAGHAGAHLDHGGFGHDAGHLDHGGFGHDAGHLDHGGFGHDAGHVGHLGPGHDVGHIGHAGGHDVGHLDHGGLVHDAGHAGAVGHDAGHLDHGSGHADVSAHGADGHTHELAHGGLGHSLVTTLLSWLSPRIIFGVLVGFGAAGLLLRPVLAAPLTAVAAVVAGIAFEAGLVGPVWKFMFRFASTPASTLVDAWMEMATATTAFDATGDGLVQIELNGELTQILGRLREQDRRAGVRVRMGDRLRVEEVDPERNACVVAWLGPGDETGADSPNA